MYIKDVLDGLYTGNSNLIIETINKSKYINDCNIDNDDVIIHLGFTFKTHKGKKFELLYSLSSYVLIRQVQNKLPCILGLHCECEDNYLKRHIPLLIEGVSMDHEHMLNNGEDYCVPITDDRFFQVFKFEQGNIVTVEKYPLKSDYLKTLHFDGEKFSVFVSDSEKRKIDEDYCNDQSDLAREREERRRDNFDAMTDGQMGSYDNFYE